MIGFFFSFLVNYKKPRGASFDVATLGKGRMRDESREQKVEDEE